MQFNLFMLGLVSTYLATTSKFYLAYQAWLMAWKLEQYKISHHHLKHTIHLSSNAFRFFFFFLGSFSFCRGVQKANYGGF